MSRSWGFAVSIVPIFALLANGCGIPVRPLAPRQAEQARLNQQAIILLRLAVEVDGQPIDTLSAWKSNETGGSSLNVFALDAVPSPRRVRPTGAPSEDARRQGWLYLHLDPGTYLIQFVPPYRRDRAFWNSRTGKLTRGATAPEDPTFWFHVSGREPVLYVGSLQVSCTSRHGIFEARLIDRCSAIRLVDETESARGIIALGSMPTTLMHESGAPLADPRVEQLLPMRLEATGTKTLNSPNFVTRGMAWAATCGESTPPIPGGEAGLAGVGILMLLLAYEAVAVPVGAITGSVWACTWGSCMDGLAEELRTFDVAQQWYASLGPSTVAIPLPAQIEAAGAHSVLQTEVLRVAVREFETSWEFRVELAVRIRLWDAAAKTLLFDETLVTGLEQAAYEGHLEVDAPCHAVEAYCGANGRQLFKEELSNAIASAAAHLRHDLGLDRLQGAAPISQ